MDKMAESTNAGDVHIIFRLYVITCCALAQSGVLRMAGFRYGNMETSTPRSSEISHVIMMILRKFDYVRATNTFAKFG